MGVVEKVVWSELSSIPSVLRQKHEGVQTQQTRRADGQADKPK